MLEKPRFHNICSGLGEYTSFLLALLVRIIICVACAIIGPDRCAQGWIWGETESSMISSFSLHFSQRSTSKAHKDINLTTFVHIAQTQVVFLFACIMDKRTSPNAKHLFWCQCAPQATGQQTGKGDFGVKNYRSSLS